MPIRPATLDDIPALLALEQTVPEAAHWSREQYESAIASRICLVLEEQGTAQAFLVARGVAEEWELENLAVSPAQRRRGLGRQLMKVFLESARRQGAATVFLEVRASNLGARAFYKNCGFIHNGPRPRYYRNPEEDAAIYRLDFVQLAVDS